MPLSNAASVSADIADLNDFADETAPAGAAALRWNAPQHAANDATPSATRTAARTAMDWWALHCLRLARQDTAQPPATFDDHVDAAYDVYSTHVMDTERQQVVPLRTDGLRPTADITRRSPVGLAWAESATAYHPVPTEPARCRLQCDTATAIDRSGESARFSLTSHRLAGEADLDLVNLSYRNLANVAQQAVTDVPEVYNSKVMRRTVLPRPDNAVIYVPRLAEARRDSVAEQLTNQMVAPSHQLPLGMHPVAPGVAYAELLQDTVAADGSVVLAPGGRAPNPNLPSFGESRAQVIAGTLEKHGDLPEDALPETLTSVLLTHRYDPTNPALIARQPER